MTVLDEKFGPRKAVPNTTSLIRSPRKKKKPNENRKKFQKKAKRKKMNQRKVRSAVTTRPRKSLMMVWTRILSVTRRIGQGLKK